MTHALKPLLHQLNFLEAAHSHDCDNCPCDGDCDPTCECGDGHDCDEMKTYEGDQDRHLTETFAALHEFVGNVRTLLSAHEHTPDTHRQDAS